MSPGLRPQGLTARVSSLSPLRRHSARYLIWALVVLTPLAKKEQALGSVAGVVEKGKDLVQHLKS